MSSQDSAHQSFLQNSIIQLPVLILAGGFGTRLQTVYDTGPKAMAPISGKPFIWYLLHTIRLAGFKRVVLCVGYKHEQIEAWAGDGSGLGLEITYSVEDEPLGTAGAIRLAAQKYLHCNSFAVMNGDSLAQPDFLELVCAHLATRAKATMVLAHVPDSGRYGRVDIDDNGRIVAFVEKSTNTGEAFINSGVYIFETSVIDSIPNDRPVSLEREILPNLVGNGLFSFKTRGYFIDIGVPEDFSRAQRELKELFR